MMIYLWSKRSPESPTRFYMFSVPAKYLPWVMLAFSFVVGACAGGRRVCRVGAMAAWVRDEPRTANAAAAQRRYRLVGAARRLACTPASGTPLFRTPHG